MNQVKDDQFTFTSENLKKAQEIVAKYPKGRQASAVMEFLDLAQRQLSGYISKEAIEYISDYLDMEIMNVYEVASFYSMYNLKPVGRNFIQVCGTTPCWLRGAKEIMDVCEKELGIKNKEMTQDKEFSLLEVECLGACVNAPVVQINDDYYEDLTPEMMKHIIDELKAGRKVKCGNQINRQCSAPFKGGK